MRAIFRNLCPKFWTVNIKKKYIYIYNRVALVYVRRAYGKRIWDECYFYRHEPHFLKSGTKSLHLILKNLKLNKVALFFVCLFVFFVKI